MINDTKINFTSLSDFRKSNVITEIDYISQKGCSLLNIMNLPYSIHIKKEFNKLYINNIQYILDDLSINDVINLLYENIPSIDLYRYEEQSEEYLNTSALFLGNFNGQTINKVLITENKTPLIVLDTYIDDKFNNKYKMQSFKLFNKYNTEIPYRIIDNYIEFESDLEVIAFVDYYAVDLKIMYLYEYVISDLKQLSDYKGGIL